MDKSKVLTLIAIEYSVDAIGQQVPVETARNVFCNVVSVTRDEWYQGGKAGLNPQFRATMFSYDYNGETICELEGVRYSIYRTFLAKGESIELYLEKKVSS